jgi:hypothetical protein
LLKASLLLVGIAVSVLAGWFGQAIPLATQWPLYDALRTTASIIFAVMGAWVTVLYPNALTRIFRRNSNADRADVDRVRVLLLPIKYSTAIIAIVLLAGLLIPLLKLSPWALGHVALLRGASFGLLTLMTLFELWAVLLSLWPAEMAQSELLSAFHKVNHVQGIVKNSGKADGAKKNGGE